MKKKSIKRERKNMVKCVECANHYGEVSNFVELKKQN